MTLSLFATSVLLGGTALLALLTMVLSANRRVAVKARIERRRVDRQR